MKDTLVRHPHIQLRKSSIHGYGVFATEDIPTNTIIEEVTFLEVPSGVLYDYAFLYPKYDTPDHLKQLTKEIVVIPQGFAPVYNHADNANVGWSTDTVNRVFVFSTIRDVKKDEELFIYYGTDAEYWSLHPHIKKA